MRYLEDQRPDVEPEQSEDSTEYLRSSESTTI